MSCIFFPDVFGSSARERNEAFSPNGCYNYDRKNNCCNTYDSFTGCKDFKNYSIRASRASSHNFNDGKGYNDYGDCNDCGDCDGYDKNYSYN